MIQEMTDILTSCAGMTRKGTLVPGMFHGVDGLGRIEIETRSGKVYSFEPQDVLTTEQAEAVQHDLKVQRVADTYSFEEISSGHGRREIRCVNPSHPVRSSYVLTITRARRSCTCQAFVKSAGAGCKHLDALELRETAGPAAPVEIEAPAKPAHTYTKEEWTS